MKKIVNKMIIIFTCLFCIICPIWNNEVYADSIEDVKAYSEFKTVEKDGEPEQYDVLIDAKDLISNEKLPGGIKTTVENVLYNTANYFTINFLGKQEDSSKTSETEKSLQHAQDATRVLTRSTFKIALNLALAFMLVVLIYLAVVVVADELFPNMHKMPLSNMVNDRTPEDELRTKKLAEQWGKAFAMLALCAFVVNVTVSFADNIFNAMEGKIVQNEKLTVYVKNSKFAVNAPILNAQGTTVSALDSSKSAEELRNKIISIASKQDTFGLGEGWCLKWVRMVYQKAGVTGWVGYNCAHEAGSNLVNASSNSDSIVPGAVVYSTKSHSNCSVCHQSAGHIGIYIGGGKIASLVNGIKICTVDEWKQTWEFSGWGWPDGTGYLAEGAVAESTGSSGDSNLSTSSGTQTKKVDYYFKTSLEGLFSFQTQYDTKDEKKFGKANLYMICWACTIAFKYFMYAVLFCRMCIIAFITAISPILIVVDAFIQVSGGKGFLSSWWKLYLYMVFLRTVIGFIYYVLVQSNVYLATQFPLYPVFISLIIMVATVISIWKTLKKFSNNMFTDFASK